MIYFEGNLSILFSILAGLAFFVLVCGYFLYLKKFKKECATLSLISEVLSEKIVNTLSQLHAPSLFRLVSEQSTNKVEIFLLDASHSYENTACVKAELSPMKNSLDQVQVWVILKNSPVRAARKMVLGPNSLNPAIAKDLEDMIIQLVSQRLDP